VRKFCESTVMNARGHAHGLTPLTTNILGLPSLNMPRIVEGIKKAGPLGSPQRNERIDATLKAMKILKGMLSEQYEIHRGTIESLRITNHVIIHNTPLPKTARRGERIIRKARDSRPSRASRELFPKKHSGGLVRSTKSYRLLKGEIVLSRGQRKGMTHGQIVKLIERHVRSKRR